MVDCGFSMRETTRRLERLDVQPGQLDAILVTHEHSDHSAGVAALSRKFGIPVYLTHGTAGTGRCDGSHSLLCFNSEDSIRRRRCGGPGGDSAPRCGGALPVPAVLGRTRPWAY